MLPHWLFPFLGAVALALICVLLAGRQRLSLFFGAVALLFAVLLLTGCAHELPAAAGPVYPFNQGLWQPTPADLAVHQ